MNDFNYIYLTILEQESIRIAEECAERVVQYLNGTVLKNSPRCCRLDDVAAGEQV